METSYKRIAMYHETDQMGIIHHSNYIKWFEEARIHLMKELEISYREMEELGIIIPVVGVNCEYKSMIRFDDEVLINLKLTSYNSITFEVDYNVWSKDLKTLYARGSSKHCFLDKNKRIISLKKSYSDYHEKFSKAL